VSRTWRSNAQPAILPRGIPFVLRIDPKLFADDPFPAAGIEVLGETEDGLLIVFSEDISLDALARKINAFGTTTGAKDMACIWQILHADAGWRLDHLVGQALRDRLPSLDDHATITLDIILAVAGHRGGYMETEANDDQNETARQRRHDTKIARRIAKCRPIARQRLDDFRRFVIQSGGTWRNPRDDDRLRDWAVFNVALPDTEHDAIVARLPPECRASGSTTTDNNGLRHVRIRYPLTDDLPSLPASTASPGYRRALIRRDELLNEAVDRMRGILRDAGLADESQIRSLQSPNPERCEPPEEIICVVSLTGAVIRTLIERHPLLIFADIAQPLADDASGPANQPAQSLPIRPPPPPHAPVVGVIDSGVQDAHPALAPAIHAAASLSFVPGDPGLADHVRPAGHGTRVAGAVLHPDPLVYPLAPGEAVPCRVANLRILDAGNLVPTTMTPALATWVAVQWGRRFGIKIFNLSANTRSRTVDESSGMDPWSTMIDLLVASEDVVLIVSAGNIQVDVLTDGLRAGRSYPDLVPGQPGRLAAPAGAMHALVVGAITADQYSHGGWTGIAPAMHATAYSRRGPGMWDEVKPDVVAFSGDCASDANTPVRVHHTLPAGPLLPQSTLYGSPPYSRVSNGTSFAAPQVAAIAAAVQAAIPDASASMLRALVVQSARWPDWAERDPVHHHHAIATLGYGVPHVGRATGSGDHRATLVTTSDAKIAPNQIHIFAVPVPDELRRRGLRVRLDITLAFSALPRLRRRHNRRYLQSWAQWICCAPQEEFDDFQRRVSAALDEDEDDVDRRAPGSFAWRVRDRRDGGIIGIRGNGGSLHKDWTYIRHGIELPTALSIAVIGRRGWDRDQDAAIPYSLAITLEALDQAIPLYALVRSRVEAEVRTRVRSGSIRVRVPGTDAGG